CPIIDLLIRKGVVKNKRQADILLVAISIVLLSLSFMISYNDRFFEFDLGNSSEEEFLYDEEQV
ncbi:hypothetical protein GW764_03970, partial [Candidatus Parcubacteria bacterium]|nr:hypothetical protein [Candidatus Parcubacteria bacterium]